MKLAIFQLIIVLFFTRVKLAFGQVPDNAPVVELSSTDFLIERSFTITITLPNTATRPVVGFPDIAGLIKTGHSSSQTISEINGKNVVSQVITQDYLAQVPGVYRVASFLLTVDGNTIRAPCTTLTVWAASGRITAPASATASLALAEKGGAFLALTASQTSIYEGQGIRLKLTFYAAENYPYELRFDQVEQQLQTITKQIRPPGAWEENAGISELRPLSILIKGRAFREFVMYQSTFYPLRSQAIRIPAVTLTMQRVKIRLSSAGEAPVSVTQTEPLAFSSQPIAIAVRPLPARPSASLMPVGIYRLVETITRSVVAPGQSIAYEFRIEGDGNIAALPPPVLMPNAAADVFPPTVHQVINRKANPVTGQKSFRYFLIPKQKGTFPLASTFRWIYFNPQSARYDTLRPQVVLQVGSLPNTFDRQVPDSLQTGLAVPGAPDSIFTGIGQIDSTHQPLNFPVLVRAVANVLLVVLMLGMMYIFFKR